jgi:hypothetical protein
MEIIDNMQILPLTEILAFFEISSIEEMQSRPLPTYGQIAQFHELLNRKVLTRMIFNYVKGFLTKFYPKIYHIVWREVAISDWMVIVCILDESLYRLSEGELGMYHFLVVQ